MLDVGLSEGRVFIGEQFSISFQRTQLVSDDLYASTPPPGWGMLPVHAVSDYRAHVPESWPSANSFFIPVSEGEALWLGFSCAGSCPSAVKVGIDGRNAVSGAEWDEGLHASPQDYMVCPPQMFMEGFHFSDGSIDQLFPTAARRTALADSESPCITIIAYGPKPGRVPEEPPSRAADKTPVLHFPPERGPDPDAKNLLGDKIEHEILQDPFGIDAWNLDTFGAAFIYILTAEAYKKITGGKPPSRPSSNDVYQGYLLP